MKIGLFSCLLAIAVFVQALASFAHPMVMQKAVSAAQSSNYNLHSTSENVQAGSLGSLSSLALTVGHQTLMVTASSMLTAAEEVAVAEILAGTGQSLVLNGRGVAVGGDFQLDSLSLQTIGSLVIPKGVTAIDNLDLSPSITLSGSLTNAGDILVEGSSPQAQEGQITALNISNTGHITAETETGSPIKVSLSLNAMNNFVNSGSVTSAGDLLVNAGGSISNIASRGGALPLIQGASVTLQASSGSFTNGGMISATASDLNISAGQGSNINFANNGGVLQANSGNINFRDANYAGSANETISGGNLSAQAVNFYSGQGIVEGNVQELNGTVNVSAQCAHIITQTNSLVLGNMDISGDPTFYNENGDVIIDGNLSFHGQSLAIIASHNIETTLGSGIIDTSSNTENGGSVLMIAGASFQIGGSYLTGGSIILSPSFGPIPAPTSGVANQQILVGWGSQTGGTIDLTPGSGISSICTSSSNANGSGGNVTLVAFSGSDPGSGRVLMPSNSTIETGGNIINGSVEIIAEANSGQAVSVGSIDTGAGAGPNPSARAGNISIIVSQPFTAPAYVLTNQFYEGTEIAPNITYVNNYGYGGATVNPDGTVNQPAGWFNPGGNLYSGAISTGNLNAPAATIWVSSAGSVQTGSISANGTFSSVGQIYVHGNSVNIDSSVQANGGTEGNSGGMVNIWSDTGSVNIGGSVSANGTGQFGNGGSIMIATGTSAGATGNTLFVSGSVCANGSGAGSGGNIQISSNDNSPFVLGSVSSNGVLGSISNCGGGKSTQGGQLFIGAGGDLTVAKGTIVDSQANEITLWAGMNGPGNLLVQQSLTSDSATGNAGSINLYCNSSDPFVIGMATTNGIAGSLRADADQSASGNGDGGSLLVVNAGTGGITAGKTSCISALAGALSGNGGSISLIASNGPLTIAQGNISVNGQYANNASTGSSSGLSTAGNPGCCNGGNIVLEGTEIQVVGKDGGIATGTLNLSANGSNASDAGTISVVASVGNLSIGGQAGGITISAISGANYNSPVDRQSPLYYVYYCCNANVYMAVDNAAEATIAAPIYLNGYYQLHQPGYNLPQLRMPTSSLTSSQLNQFQYWDSGTYTGKVYVSAGANLNVDMSAVAVGPAGTNAAGANIYLIAGTGSSGGALSVSGNVSADGSGTGDGGFVVLASNSTSALSAYVTANGGNGTVVIATTGPANVNVQENPISPVFCCGAITPTEEPYASFITFGQASAEGAFCCAGRLDAWSAPPVWNCGGCYINIIATNAIAFANFSFITVSNGSPMGPPLYIPFSMPQPQPSPVALFPPSTTFISASPTLNAIAPPINAVGSASSNAVTFSASAVEPLGITISGSSNTGAIGFESSSLFAGNLDIAGYSAASIDTAVVNVSAEKSETLASNALGAGGADIKDYRNSDEGGQTGLKTTFLSAGGSEDIDFGNFLIAPEENAFLETAEGGIEIGKGCIAIVINTKDGVALYDLHDSHSGSVKAHIGARVIALTPGTHVLLTSNEASEFEQVNPGSMIAYRNVSEVDTASNIKAFTSEFSLTSAIAQMGTFSQMSKTGNARERRILSQLLKNAAILSQIGNSRGPFRTGSKKG